MVDYLTDDIKKYDHLNVGDPEKPNVGVPSLASHELFPAAKQAATSCYWRIDDTIGVHLNSSALTYLTSVIHGICADPPQAPRKLKASKGRSRR